jgi:alanine racemase
MRATERPSVTIDLPRVRASAEAIRARTGVPLIAVVKADAYGLGATRVVEAIHDVADAFYVFEAAEALPYADVDTKGKLTIAMLGASDDVNDYVSRRIRPCVWSVERAKLLRRARPVLSLDTGQRRLGCLPEVAQQIVATGACEEAMTHATTVEQARMLRQTLGGKVATLHAAGTVLLDYPEAWLDATRPGLALYAGAVRVTARLIEVRDATGPAGYSGFSSSTGRLGVILGGYSDGLRPGGMVSVNGERRFVPEVGMQSAFVELGPSDKAGDEVVLLGDGVTEQDVAAAWGTSPHEALVRLAGMGTRRYT